jgi:hypothetical protein
VLDQSNWQEAKGLLPPELLQHYRDGQFVNVVGELKDVKYALDDTFWAAAKQNEGKFKIDDNGSVVEVATGKPPEYSYGPPFPTLDPNDPQIALKILWNYQYAYWSNGSSVMHVHLMWLDDGSRRPEREISLHTATKVIEGNRIREPNPQQFSRLDRMFLFEPADLHGSATLGWRYKDAKKRDSMWTYVPALRRVRQVSPSNRSDGIFGSEMTQDDGFNGFDGKPEDFTYKLVAQKDELVTLGPEAIDGTMKFIPHPKGRGWVFDTPESRYGFRTAGWKGLPWAPLDNRLVKRPVWLIEATPTDRYYLYGKVLMGIDRENYKVATVVKYDWKGQGLGIVNRGVAFGQAPDGVRYVNITGGVRGGAYAENLRMRRATAADPAVPGTRVEVDPKLDNTDFALENLARMGR